MQDLEKMINEILKLPESEALKTIVRSIVAPDFDKAFDNSRRVLCVAPHPDDCEVGAGGTIAALVKLGKDVFFAVLSDGCLGTSDPSLFPQKLAEIRRLEQEEAAKMLGVKNVFWLGYKDGYVPYNKEARAKLVTLIRFLKPDLILAPDPWLSYEAHPDHRNTGFLAAEATMVSSLPHYVEEDLLKGLEPWKPKYIAFYYTSKPNFYYDITNYIEAKLKALKIHKSQFEANWDMFEALIKFIAAVYGKRAGVKYAEAFKLLPTSLIHAVPFAEMI